MKLTAFAVAVSVVALSAVPSSARVLPISFEVNYPTFMSRGI